MQTNKRAFTLIELLVVVLIIGILAAVAVPMYKHAVLKSHFSIVMTVAKAVADAQEVYYLGKNSYALEQEELDVLPGQPENVSVAISQKDGYDYVMAQNSKVPGTHYIVYQKHSENFPGEIHCEAQNENTEAQWLCSNLSQNNNIGETLTSGYTTYVLSGGGVRAEPPAPATCCVTLVVSRKEEDCSVRVGTKGGGCMPLFVQDDIVLCGTREEIEQQANSYGFYGVEPMC